MLRGGVSSLLAELSAPDEGLDPLIRPGYENSRSRFLSPPSEVPIPWLSRFKLLEPTPDPGPSRGGVTGAAVSPILEDLPSLALLGFPTPIDRPLPPPTFRSGPFEITLSRSDPVTPDGADRTIDGIATPDLGATGERSGSGWKLRRVGRISSPSVTKRPRSAVLIDAALLLGPNESPVKLFVETVRTAPGTCLFSRSSGDRLCRSLMLFRW